MFIHSSVALAQKSVHFQDVKKEPEVHQGDALPTVGVEGAKRQAATKELKERPSSVKLTEGESAVTTSDVPKALKAALNSA